MRAALTALTDELKRLKAEGVKTVMVSDDALLALRSVVRARAAAGHGSNLADQKTIAVKAEKSAEISKSPPPGEQPAKAAVPVVATPKSDFPSPPTFVLPDGDKKTR